MTMHFTRKVYAQALDRARSRAVHAAIILNIVEGYAEAMPHNSLTLGVLSFQVARLHERSHLVMLIERRAARERKL